MLIDISSISLSLQGDPACHDYCSRRVRAEFCGGERESIDKVPPLPNRRVLFCRTFRGRKFDHAYFGFTISRDFHLWRSMKKRAFVPTVLHFTMQFLPPAFSCLFWILYFFCRRVLLGLIFIGNLNLSWLLFVKYDESFFFSARMRFNRVIIQVLLLSVSYNIGEQIVDVFTLFWCLKSYISLQRISFLVYHFLISFFGWVLNFYYNFNPYLKRV